MKSAGLPLFFTLLAFGTWYGKPKKVDTPPQVRNPGRGGFSVHDLHVAHKG